jgi:hypothetical protein
VTGIDVRCEAVGVAWRCRVRVSDEAGASDYDVTIHEPGRFLPDAGVTDMDRLVRETFAFLLEREPRASILRRFDLAVVERYFPDYPREIRRRLGR